VTRTAGMRRLIAGIMLLSAIVPVIMRPPAREEIAERGRFRREAVVEQPDVRHAIGLVWPDHRAEPLLTRALITTVREVDLVTVLDRSAAPGR
jgi:hypothetical protein